MNTAAVLLCEERCVFVKCHGSLTPSRLSYIIFSCSRNEHQPPEAELLVGSEFLVPMFVAMQCWRLSGQRRVYVCVCVWVGG